MTILKKLIEPLCWLLLALALRFWAWRYLG